MAAGKQASLMGCVRLMLSAGLQPLSIVVEGVREMFGTSVRLQNRTGSIVTHCFSWKSYTCPAIKKKMPHKY